MAADFNKKHVGKHVLLLIGCMVSGGQVETCLLNDLRPIGGRNALLVKPTQKGLAALHPSALQFECNRLMMLGGTSSAGTAGSACKLPGTCRALASRCQILRRSLRDLQQARQKRPGAVQFQGEFPKAYPGPVYGSDRPRPVEIPKGVHRARRSATAALVSVIAWPPP